MGLETGSDVDWKIIDGAQIESLIVEILFNF